MNTLTKITAAGIAVAAATLPAFADTKSYTLDGFDEISLSAGLEAEITIGPEFSIVADARDADLFDRLELSVRGHTLYADRDNSLMDFLFDGTQRLRLTITLPALDEISASAGADAYVTGAFGTSITASASSGASIELDEVGSDEVNLATSSGGDIDVNGTCERLEAEVSSGADLDARELECRDAIVSASSGGDADVFVSGKLIANASSGGDVTVWGDPENTDISDSSGGDTHLRN